MTNVAMDVTRMSMPPLEVRRLSPEWIKSLGAFFRDLREAGDEAYFHPHPLTDEQADALGYYQGLDLYYVMVQGDRVLGYGLLRGWDEGYQIPSLGIAIHPSARGRKLGLALMHFLHAAARQAGAAKVRLKVYSSNIAARRLYETIGYRFDSGEAGQLVGVLDL